MRDQWPTVENAPVQHPARNRYCNVFHNVVRRERAAKMKVPFTWKVTGWFMIGWSAEFEVGAVKALKYFGEDLAAYRDESGQLHVLEAHCKHLGAHIGHGGKVVGDCIECPFHGWRWGPEGNNTYIPYQPDQPNRGLRLRSYPVQEQYGCIFMWYQPDGEPRSGNYRTSS